MPGEGERRAYLSLHLPNLADGFHPSSTVHRQHCKSVIAMIPPTHQLNLRFFDLDVHIRSDSRACLAPFARMYRRFQVNGDSSPLQPPVEFAIFTQSDNVWGQPVLTLDEQAFPLHDARLLAGYVHQNILCAILARVQSHILVHAGVVACDGQGFILAADSFHGKTTLVLELVQRGFKFLSDETAALGRVDWRVHPFPRGLRIRPGSLELAGLTDAATGAPAWLGKILLDVEQLQPNSLGQAVPIRHVIVLRDPSEEEEKPDHPGRPLSVLVDRLDEAFLTAVRQIEGVSEVRTDIERGYPLIRLRAARRTFVFSQIEALCRERRLWVLDVIADPPEQPSFATSARLETLPRSQAVVELLRRFQGGYKSAILDELGGSSTRLFMELAAIIGQAQCHRLLVGPLHEMADLVCGLVRKT